jgi:hypothetical protein
MISFMAEYFVFGTIGFWICFALCVLIVTALSETDSPWWAGFVLIGTMTVLCTANGIGLSTITNNPLESIAAVVGYFVCGVLWSLVKWWRFLVSALENYNELKASFYAGFDRHDTEKKMKMTEDEKRLAWKEQVKSMHFSSIRSTPPSPADHKKDIVTWMTYWPLSVVVTLLDDPIRRMFNLLYSRFVTTYDQISNHVFGDVKKDFE